MQPDIATEAPPAIRLSNVGRRYGGILALDDVNLSVVQGEVHSLVGENGAGKSTCLGVISGRVVPDSGTVSVLGSDLEVGNPRASRDAGVAAIYQELTVVPTLTTEANVFLGQESAAGFILRAREMAVETAEMADRLGVEVPIGVAAGSLSVGVQQLLEVMRALVRSPKVVLFDEPTAALAPRERDGVYRVIDWLKRSGRTVVFVSHNLEEVLRLSDTVSAFKDGRLVATEKSSHWTKQSLVRAMLGEAQTKHSKGESRSPIERSRDSVLRVRNLCWGGGQQEIDIDLHKGEILGLGGLVGSGRTSVLRAIAGDSPSATGRLTTESVERRWPRSVREAREQGTFLIPEKRKESGLVMTMTAEENMLLASWESGSKAGLYQRGRGHVLAATMADRTGFDRNRLGDRAETLSGGNQQKLLIARAMLVSPRVLLADEPTRGIDVGAKAEIMDLLRTMARSDTAIIFVSSDLEELVDICDRVIVMSEGTVAGSIDSRRELSVAAILEIAFDARSESP